MNAVVLAVLVMLALSLLRVNVVIALTISAIIGGLTAGLDLATTLSAFSDGLGGNANVALSYAFLGAFAVAISKSGITDLLAQKVIKAMGAQNTHSRQSGVKVVLISAIAAMAVMSQNAVPVHIAFIPILIPPLLHVFAQMQLDRRLIACVLCFGLVTTYMVLPLGFGGIYLHDILLKQLVDHGLTGATAADVPKAMLLPGLGMVAGLLIAIFISYRKPRLYQLDKILEVEPEAAQVNTSHIIVALVAIVAALGAQLYTGSMIVGGLLGFVIFVAGGVIRYQDTQDAFTKGVHMMAMIGFIMITAAGFAAVMKATGQIETLVTTSADWIGNSKGLAAFMMLLVGLLITMGIGSSFSTVPIIAAIFVPLALHLGFSPLAIIALVGTAGALGDAGSPSSDSTLGPTSGLNVDGQHDHIWDTVVPTFLHYNLPLMLMGWVAAMVL